MYESVVFSCRGIIHMYKDKRKRKEQGRGLIRSGSTTGYPRYRVVPSYIPNNYELLVITNKRTIIHRVQDASYICTCDRSGNRVTRDCGRTGMSAGVRKGAKWVGDCGWLSLGRGEILKRSLHP